MIFFILLLGLLVGSFLNVCIYRIPKGESIVYPPSHCARCGHRLGVMDLIPVLSFLFLRGKCRYCGGKISPRYILIELLTSIVYILCYLKFGPGYEFIKSVILLSILIPVTFIDLDYSIIPLNLMIFGLVSGIILSLIGYKLDIGLLDYIYGFLLGGGVIFLIVALTGGMGGGDIQLMAVIGLFLGWKLTLLTLFLSFIIGGAAGTILIILKKKSRKDYIPFGPWIALAAFFSVYFGGYIINWYVSLL